MLGADSGDLAARRHAESCSRPRRIPASPRSLGGRRDEPPPSRHRAAPRRPRGRPSAPRAGRPALGRSPLEVHGTARLGKRTKELVKRLGPGDVAIIDHRDLDRMAAEDLVECGVKGVVNVAPSTSSRYPNPGPLILARAGVQLVDAVGAPLFEELVGRRHGRSLRGGTVLGPTGVVAEGEVRTLDGADRRSRASSRSGSARRSRTSPRTRSTHIRDERELLAGRLQDPGPAHGVPRPPRADRRARHRLPARPAGDPALHPRPAAGAGRRRRRRRRAARGRAEARPDHRRHGLGLGQGARVRRRARRARLPGRLGARARAPRAARARPQGPARARHEPGRRDAARLRARRAADRDASDRTST